MSENQTPGESGESAAYRSWEEAALFTANAERVDRDGKHPPYVITMPPPNVTAVLHMGHGLNNTVQDVLVRWRRMCGDEALWVPGMDHAGIATQNVVEKLLAREGQTRFDLGREAFVRRTEEFVEETGGTILRQLRAIGASADWNRTAYTLSPALSTAVREAFVQLFERGLIYRGHRVIHWCTRCLTSLSDEEAEFESESNKLYHIRYPVVRNAEGNPLTGVHVTVATTRPETMLGDVAVAVHPDDSRFAEIRGGVVQIPIIGSEIPVITDAYVDPEFGTGVVKITPAHDPNDYEVGMRHSLSMPVIMSPTGTMQEMADAGGRVPAELAGLDRFVARKKIVALLEEEGLLAAVEEHQNNVRHCYRCATVVEPRLSDQWFVKMAPLAEPAIAAVRSGEIRILPERWEAVYLNWLENIRDWNISRQLWWGHRVPVWYCDACPQVIASRDTPASCPQCGGPLRQDEDVLDTWFSSWLWPLSTLGWPDAKSEDLRKFYPTDALVTAPEILFFWVARMIFAGFAFAGKAPFHTVYLHGTVRDTNHVKMSKSLGNGIDPLDVVELYGADALRYTVVAGMGMGADLILDPKDLEQSFSAGRNFVTKLRNICRFILGNVSGVAVKSLDEIPAERLTRADLWILGRLNVAIAECDAALGPARPTGDRWKPEELRLGMRLNEYAEAARRFVWNELADWYLESTKSRLNEGGADRDLARAVLVHCFDNALRLLQPIVPFVTDEVWKQLPIARDTQFLAVASWPTVRVLPDGGGDFEMVREVIGVVRQIRADYAIPPSSAIDVTIVTGKDRDAALATRVFTDEKGLIQRLTNSRVVIGAEEQMLAAAAHAVLQSGSSAVVPLGGVVDIARECRRLRSEVEQLEKQLSALRGRLSNEGFLSRAPENVVASERAKESEWAARRERLVEKVQSLCGKKDSAS